MHYFISLLIVSSIAAAQSEEIPCPRNQPVIAYHQQEMAIYLFGGYCSSEKKRLNDLWKFDGKSWIPMVSKKAPVPRSGHAMIYDHSENRLLVFGGKDDKGNLLDDTWVWKEGSWKELKGKAPAPRQSHRLAFNSGDGTILLFGGSGVDGNGLSDTWLFKGDKWVKWEVGNQPSPRLQHTLSFDPERNVMVLFGGFNRTDAGKQIFGDTWEWRPLEGWTLMADNKEMARDHHAMAYDANQQSVILSGGYNQGYLGDTWSWDGSEWQKVLVDDRLARAGKPGLIYDSEKEALILFGGWDRNNKPLMDFWQFDAHQRSWNLY